MQPALAESHTPAETSLVLTGPQIRAARALLKWTVRDLAAQSGVSYSAIQAAEQAPDMPNMHTRNLLAIKTALESAGILFLAPGDTRDGGPGVRLR